MTAAHEQAEPDQLLAGACRRHVGQLDQRGHQGRVDAAAQHRGPLDDRAAGAVESRDTVEDGVRERLGHAGVTLRERAQVLHDTQRVPGRAGHHLLAVSGEPRRGGEGVDGRPGEGAQPDDRCPVGQPRGHVGVLGPHSGHEQDPGVAEPAGEVPEQVDGRGTAVLEVVDAQQHGPLERQPA